MLAQWIFRIAQDRRLDPHGPLRRLLRLPLDGQRLSMEETFPPCLPRATLLSVSPIRYSAPSAKPTPWAELCSRSGFLPSVEYALSQTEEKSCSILRRKNRFAGENLRKRPPDAFSAPTLTLVRNSGSWGWTIPSRRAGERPMGRTALRGDRPTFALRDPFGALARGGTCRKRG